MPTTSSRSVSVRSGAIFEQHRRRTRSRRDAVTGIDDACQQIVEYRRLLQIAQARRVGRGNIHGDVARDRREPLDQPHIVGGAIGRIFVGADIDADNSCLPRSAARVGLLRWSSARGKPHQHGVGALRIEAEPVDDAMVGIKAEQPRPRIAGLRLRRDGADFDKTEADAQQRIRHFGVLVEAGGDADRIRKIEAEDTAGEPPVVARRRRQRREFQHPDRHAMRILRIERTEERPRQAIKEADHGSSSGNERRPAASSSSGVAQRTAASGNAP